MYLIHFFQKAQTQKKKKKNKENHLWRCTYFTQQTSTQSTHSCPQAHTHFRLLVERWQYFKPRGYTKIKQPITVPKARILTNDLLSRVVGFFFFLHKLSRWGLKVKHGRGEKIPNHSLIKINLSDILWMTQWVSTQSSWAEVKNNIWYFMKLLSTEALTENCQTHS